MTFFRVFSEKSIISQKKIDFLKTKKIDFKKNQKLFPMIDKKINDIKIIKKKN
jgi:hypothetical protein